MLDPEDMVIADDSGVISLAAIMGGATTEVSETTTDVLFEAAHWDPMTIARSSRRHRLSSEASRRFERGVDPAVGPVAVERAVELLVRYGGGKADERVLDLNAVAPREPIVIAVRLPVPRGRRRRTRPSGSPRCSSRSAPPWPGRPRPPRRHARRPGDPTSPTRPTWPRR